MTITVIIIVIIIIISIIIIFIRNIITIKMVYQLWSTPNSLRATPQRQHKGKSRQPSLGRLTRGSKYIAQRVQVPNI